MILNILTFIVSVLRGLAEKQWMTKKVLRIGKTVFGRLHISRASAVQSSC